MTETHTIVPTTIKARPIVLLAPIFSPIFPPVHKILSAKAHHKNHGCLKPQVHLASPQAAIRDIGPLVKHENIILEICKMLYRESIAILAALRHGQSIIEYEIDGTIVDANEKFLSLMGYRIAEIVGKHHSIFVEPFYRDSRTYRVFWEKLRAGEPQNALFKRIARNGREVWFDASYNVITDAQGQPFKVVTLASDIAITTISCRHADGPKPGISGRVIAGPAACRRA